MVLYFDTETTGLNPGYICQLSYIMQSKDKLRSKNFFFSVPSIEPSAQAVHGFSVEKLRQLSNGKVFADFIDEIQEDFESADIIVAHNLVFDLMFLRTEFERCNRELNFQDYLCSMKTATTVCKLPKNSGCGYKYPTLKELGEYFGVDDYDAKETVEILFDEQVGFHDARFDTTVLYLALKRGMKKEQAFYVLEVKL